MENTIAIIGICVALIFNCWSLWSTKKAHQQNVNVQLFKKRYAVYVLLQKWCGFASRLTKESEMNHVEIIYSWGNNKLMKYINEFYYKGKKYLTDPDGKTMEELIPTKKLINYYFKKLVKREQCKLNMAPCLYVGNIFNNIERFTEEFLNVVKDILDGDETNLKGKILKLKIVHEELRCGDILDAMKKQLYELRNSL